MRGFAMSPFFKKKVSLKSTGYSIKNVSVLGLLLFSGVAQAAILENPGSNQLYSGIGVISGWKCRVNGPLTVRFNDGHSIPLVYGSERTDVRDHGACASANVGFTALWNWANLGDGHHTAVVYDNGVEFARSTFQVGTTGEEFLRGANARVWVEDFPAPGERTRFVWNQNTQHLELAEVGGPALADAGECSLETVPMLIENGGDLSSLDQRDQTSILMLRLQPEAAYVDAWCVAQGGRVEVRLPDGTRADCVLPGYAVEADFANKWYEGVGQAAHYAQLLQKRPGILLILEHSDDCRYFARMCATLTGVRIQEQPIKVWTTGPVSCLLPE